MTQWDTMHDAKYLCSAGNIRKDAEQCHIKARCNVVETDGSCCLHREVPS